MGERSFLVNEKKLHIFICLIGLTSFLTYDPLRISAFVMTILNERVGTLLEIPSIRNLTEFASYADGMVVSLIFSGLILLVFTIIMIFTSSIKYQLPVPGTVRHMAPASERLKILVVVAPCLILYTYLIFIPLVPDKITWVHFVYKLEWALILFLSLLTLTNIEFIAYIIELIKEQRGKRT